MVGELPQEAKISVCDKSELYFHRGELPDHQHGGLPSLNLMASHCFSSCPSCALRVTSFAFQFQNTYLFSRTGRAFARVCRRFARTAGLPQKISPIEAQDI